MAERVEKERASKTSAEAEKVTDSEASEMEGARKRRRSAKKKPDSPEATRVPRVIADNPGMSEEWKRFYRAFCKSISL